MTDNLITEVWKPVPGWPNYEVSNLGRVKRIPCWSENKYKWLKERLLKITKDRSRGASKKYVYCYVNLGTSKKIKMFSVARLVLLAFVGPPRPDQECRHLDDNSENCVLENLEWGTRLENRADAIRNGVIARGSRNGAAILTEALVLEIREVYKPYSRSFGALALARKYGVKDRTVHDILTRITWKHV